MMNWNVSLLVFSLAMTVIFAGVGMSEHLPAAEAIAEELAPRIGANEDQVRAALEVILQRGSLRRTLVSSAPWAVMTTLLAMRVIRAGKRKTAETKSARIF